MTELPAGSSSASSPTPTPQAGPLRITPRGAAITGRGNLAHPRPIPQRARGPGRLTGGDRVVIQAWTLALQISAQLGPAGAQITGGYGTWTSVAVPRADPLTQWAGRTALTLNLNLLFDGWRRQVSVEPALATLEALATKQPGMLTPPSLRIYGAIPHAGQRWVINDLTWAGDALRHPRTGERYRQGVMVHLIKYNDPAAAVIVSRGVAHAAPPQKYTVRPGDTLRTIAAHRLGASSKWPQIAAANAGLRGWQIPSSWVGRTIKVPPR